MMTMKFDLGTYIITMGLLFLGGFVAGYIIPWIPSSNPLVTGILTGIIQMTIIAFFGFASGKLDLLNVIIGGILIFIGGIAGGYLVSYLALTGYVATIIVLVVQVLFLSALGLLRGSKSVVPMKGIGK